MQPSQDAPSRLDGPVSSGTASRFKSTHIHPSQSVSFNTAPVLEEGEIAEQVQSPVPTLDTRYSRPPKNKRKLCSYNKKMRRKQLMHDLGQLHSLLESESQENEVLPCGICHKRKSRVCQQAASRTTNPRFIIKHPIDAGLFAAEVSKPNRMPNKPCLVFYTDGAGAEDSKHDPLVAGFGVIYKQISRDNISDWIDSSYGIIGTNISNISELYAVGLALDIAAKKLETMLKIPHESDEDDDLSTLGLVLITDSQSALCYIHDYIWMGKIPPMLSSDTFLQLMRPIVRLKQLNVQYEFHWVPGHMGIEGNVRADALAGEAIRWTRSSFTSVTKRSPSEYQVVQIPNSSEQAYIDILGPRSPKRESTSEVSTTEEHAAVEILGPQPAKRKSISGEVLDSQASKWSVTPEEELKTAKFVKRDTYASMAEQIQEMQAQWMRSVDAVSSELRVSAELQDKRMPVPDILNPTPLKRKAGLDKVLDPRPPRRISKVEEALDPQDPKFNLTPEEKPKLNNFVKRKAYASMAEQIHELQAQWMRSSYTTSPEL